VALGAITGHHQRMDQDKEGAVRVFLLDDHEVVRRGLREVLEQSGDIEVVGEAARADEALRRIPCGPMWRCSMPGYLMAAASRSAEKSGPRCPRSRA
jgi:hypothetical protein